MALNFSTGYDNKSLGRAAGTTGDGFSGIFHQCVIDVYGGVRPTSANNPPNATKLGTVTVNDDGVTGLTWEAPANGAVTKKVSEIWKFHGLAEGTATWFRIRTAADDDSQSSFYPRADGIIAATGGDATMSNRNVVLNSPHTVDTCTVGYPVA
jgi:hypothetical protein